jgi:UPF0176 protein
MRLAIAATTIGDAFAGVTRNGQRPEVCILGALRTMPAARIVHISFYRFVRIEDTPLVARVLRELTQGLLGTLLVAHEGINGTLAGDLPAIDRFETALTTDERFGSLFAGIDFKRSDCTTPPFQRMKVHERGEILPLGIAGVDATGKRGTQLDPKQWRELLDADDVVLIDNRNSFEHRLGRFRGAIDPMVGNFRDLPAYVDANAAQWKAEGKRVAMYCTGGIRCEKTAVWMHDLGVEIHQLEGGILRYLAETPGADRDWQGECFVFDNRIALDSHLQETSTTAEDVYSASPDEAWRLERARRLDAPESPDDLGAEDTA